MRHHQSASRSASRSARRIAAVLTAGSLGATTLAVLALAGPAQAAATCRGATTTILGTPGVPLTGTPGNDVVVTNGATVVSTLGGDDVVCVTGGTAYVDTATGADVVDSVSAGGAPVSAWLGPGADQFHGGDGADTVGTHAEELVPDTDADTILTGGGDDTVRSGTAGEDNDDVVDLGDGNDRLVLRGVSAGKATAVSGGRNSDVLDLDLSGSAPWWLDNTKGLLNRAKKRQHDFTAFERFEVLPTTGRFTFLGSPSNERLVYVHPAGGPVGEVVVAMGPGNDEVVAPPQAPATSRYDAGDGRDELSLLSPGDRLTVDLSLGRVFRGGRQRGGQTASLAGFDDVTLVARNATAKGDDSANRLVVGGCTVRAYGLGGRDLLRRLDDETLDCRKRAKLLGGAGPDRLVGGVGRDKLFGGPGRDRGDGGAGRDVCRTEKRKACERR
ncbi:hypothetical protein [Nocardioides solisilvae]|uniref:hypothetical protein n=1 Tax=Nocardioides solisilvae TaxID=1542435 RepID=UPI00194E670F|nr:hypothetical protein [Nocardioides solisilvae]